MLILYQTGIEFDGAYFHNGKESIDREKRKYKKCQELGIKLIRIKDAAGATSYQVSDITFSIENLKENDNVNTIIRMIMRDLDPSSNMWYRKNPSQIWSSIDQTIDVDKDYFEIVADKYLRETSKSFVNDNSELLKDWDYEINQNINPYSLTKGCSFKVNWKCHICGYKWKARIRERIRGSGCPCCNRSVLVSGVNDFATLYPAELDEWDYESNELAPNEIISYNKKVSWKCSKCGHKWTATIHDKVIRKDKTGCPNCANKSVALKRHQRAMKNGGLFDKYPDLIKQWNFNKNKGIDISDIASGSCTRYWWTCEKCGYEWESSPGNRTHGHRIRKCPKCRN